MAVSWLTNQVYQPLTNWDDLPSSPAVFFGPSIGKLGGYHLGIFCWPWDGLKNPAVFFGTYGMKSLPKHLDVVHIFMDGIF